MNNIYFNTSEDEMRKKTGEKKETKLVLASTQV
jgi:hypothetical protein